MLTREGCLIKGQDSEIFDDKIVEISIDEMNAPLY